MDDRAWNAINLMNSIKSSFTPKRGRNFGRKKKSTNSVKNMTKVFVEGTRDSFGKISKTEEVVREERK